MSQFYVNTSSSNIPPDILTSVTTDVKDNTPIGPGNAVPSGNNIKILARASDQYNNDGIRTDADPNSSNQLYVELTNQITGSLTTTDAVPQVLASADLGSVAGTYFMIGNIVVWSVTDQIGAAYSFEGAAYTNGIAGTEIGTEQKSTFEPVILELVDFDFMISGNTAEVVVTGIAGKTLNWNGYFTYRYVG